MEWRVIPDFPDYEVSEFGHVRRCRSGKTRAVTGKHLKPHFPHGYVAYTLMRDGKRCAKSGHRLVAEAFLGPPPFEGAEACHDDGTRTNNHYTNLRWDTRLNNKMDRHAHGTDFRGSRNPRALLGEEQVRSIRRMAAKMTQRAIADRFEVSDSTIGAILSGQNWAHVI